VYVPDEDAKFLHSTRCMLCMRKDEDQNASRDQITSGNSEGAPGAEEARRGVRVGEVLAHSQSSRSHGLPWLSDS